MAIRRALYALGFLLVSLTAGAQINIYLGANLQGNFSWIRGDEHTFKPGMGGGFSFVYWEYEYWFFKAGLDYNYKHSSSLEYPDLYDTEITSPDDRVNFERLEHGLGVPLTIFFRPWEWDENTLLILGSLQTTYTLAAKEKSDEFGEVSLDGSQIHSRVKTGLGIGVGYQRQLDRHTYLNIYPSFNFDMRADRAFNSITLTAEILFGVY